MVRPRVFHLHRHYYSYANATDSHALYDSESLSIRHRLPDMLVGSGYGPLSLPLRNSVRKLTNSDRQGTLFADVQNVSWMLQLDASNILMNNEFGDGTNSNSGELYIIDSNGVQKDCYNLTSQGLACPVYFSKYKNKIYVACYSSWKVPGSAGIYVFPASSRIQDGKAYKPLPSSTTTLSAIHMIDAFTYTNKDTGRQESFLLAVDILARCVYKMNPDSIDFQTKVLEFDKLFPRHFVQIPNTNYIALITERGENGTNQTPVGANQALVMILEYDGEEQFQLVDKVDLGLEFIHNEQILKGITGAEIKHLDGDIYVTVRGYVEPYKDWKTVPANGLFIKLRFHGKKLKIHSYVTVGKDPRCFAIKDGFAYVANHLGVNEYDPTNLKPGDISITNVARMSQHRTRVVAPGNIAPLFILLQ